MIPATALHRVLHNAALFAGTSPALPELRLITLESDGYRILAAATDRFALAVCTAEWEGPPFTARIDLTHAKTIIKAAKTPDTLRHKRIAHMEVTTGGLRFAIDGEGVTVPVDTETATMPVWRRHLPTSGTAASCTSVELDRGILGKLSRVVSIDPAARLYHLPTGTVGVLIGDEFAAAVQRRRMTTDLWVRPAFLEAAR